MMFKLFLWIHFFMLNTQKIIILYKYLLFVQRSDFIQKIDVCSFQLVFSIWRRASKQNYTIPSTSIKWFGLLTFDDKQLSLIALGVLCTLLIYYTHMCLSVCIIMVFLYNASKLYNIFAFLNYTILRYLTSCLALISSTI